MSKETYYEILGINADATEDDIRKAYRKQALLWHPDKNAQRKEEAEAKFKLIAEAYEVLSDTEKRKTYDLYGEEGLKNGGTNYDYDSSSSPHFPFQFHDPRELFNMFFGRDPFADMFGDPFGGMSRPPFGMSGFGMPSRSRSLFDDHPLFSSKFDNFGSSGASSYSFSSSSSSFSGGQGGYVRKSTTRRTVNGVTQTITETEDAEGNVTVVTETSDGNRQVLINNQPQKPQALIDEGRRVNIPVQDGNLFYGQRQPQLQQQYQQHQQPPFQQQQYQQQQYQQQPYQQQPYQQQPYQQQQYQQQPYQQQQYQQQYQQQQYQDPPQQQKGDEHYHRKHFWNRKKE